MKNATDTVSQMEAILNELKDDAAKFDDKGNASAGSRLRKGGQALKVLAQDLRKGVQEKKNAERAAKKAEAPVKAAK